MKKLIGTVAVAALLASAAFAELNFGAWLKNLAGVVASDGDDINAGITNPWGSWRAARLGASFVSEDEKFGMEMGLAWENGAPGFFANNLMWVQPWDFLKVSVGAFDNWTGLRGDLVFGSWGWLRPNNAIRWGEGITFSPCLGSGLLLELFPVDGLQIAVGVPYSADYTAVEDVYRNANIAAAYTIGDAAKIKVQWIGKSTDKKAAKTAGWYYDDKELADATDFNDAVTKARDLKDDDGNALDFDVTKFSYLAKDAKATGGVENLFEIAFDLTAVDNLFLTVGAALDIAEESDNNVYTIALGASYNITDTFALFLDGSVAIPGNSDLDPLFGAALGINVGLTDSLGLEAEVRWLHQAKEAEIVSFLVGLNYSVSSGAGLGLGFQGLVAGKNAVLDESTNTKPTFPALADKFSWAVPIYCTISF